MSATLLTLVVFLPAAGALAIALLLGKERTNEIKWAANIILFVDFVLSLLLLRGFDFDTAEALRFRLQYDFLPSSIMR